MQLKNIFVFGILILALAGCVNKKNMNLSQDVATSMMNKQLTLTKRDRQDFAVLTYGQGLFGGLGIATTVSKGNKLAKKHNLQDPAVQIAKSLGNKLAKKHKLVVKPNDGKILDTKDTADIAAMYPSVDYVLDVQTFTWGVYYFPTNWKRYRVIYAANLRLVEVATQKMVSQGYCRYEVKDTKGAPNYDELFGNDAALLKQKLQSIAEYCTSEFNKNSLNMP